MIVNHFMLCCFAEKLWCWFLFFYTFIVNVTILLLSIIFNANNDRFAVLFNIFIYTLQRVIRDSFGQLASVCSSQRAWSLSAENFAETFEMLWFINYRCCVKLWNTESESPWCNHTGWLGVKHQVTYLLKRKMTKSSCFKTVLISLLHSQSSEWTVCFQKFAFVRFCGQAGDWTVCFEKFAFVRFCGQAGDRNLEGGAAGSAMLSDGRRSSGGANSGGCAAHPHHQQTTGNTGQCSLVVLALDWIMYTCTMYTGTTGNTGRQKYTWP